MLSTIRTHWAVENDLHRSLDVAFREDDSRVRQDQAQQNMASTHPVGVTHRGWAAPPRAASPGSKSACHACRLRSRRALVRARGLLAETLSSLLAGTAGVATEALCAEALPATRCRDVRPVLAARLADRAAPVAATVVLDKARLAARS